MTMSDDYKPDIPPSLSTIEPAARRHVFSIAAERKTVPLRHLVPVVSRKKNGIVGGLSLSLSPGVTAHEPFV
jgi:hypothetical protein